MASKGENDGGGQKNRFVFKEKVGGEERLLEVRGRNFRELFATGRIVGMRFPLLGSSLKRDGRVGSVERIRSWGGEVGIYIPAMSYVDTRGSWG